MPEIDVAEVDRDLLGVGRLAAELIDIVGHDTILLPSAWMVNGGAAPGFKRRDVEFQARVLTPLRCASEPRPVGQQHLRLRYTACGLVKLVVLQQLGRTLLSRPLMKASPFSRWFGLQC